MPNELLDKALESVGGLEGFKRTGEQFKQDLAFIDEHREELLAHYNERWVAVYKGEVVGYGRHYNRILAGLQRLNLPVDQIPIRYLSKRKVFALYCCE